MVMDLQITADRQIVAATHGKGVFRSSLFTPPVTLPVKFESFTGVKAATENQLSWRVSGEQNLDKYELESSTDGVRYTKLATLKAKNSGGVVSYSQPDRSRQISAPVVYYRLKAVDANGAQYYSEVVILKNQQAARFRVLGNPFQSHISLRYEATVQDKMVIQLCDMSGRVLRTETQAIQAGTGYYTINNLNGLASGQYILRITAGKEQFTERVMKQ
jgi:hypothetical protein